MPRRSSRYHDVAHAPRALAAVVALVWLAACAATGGQPAAAPGSAPAAGAAGAAAPAARGTLRFAVAGLDSNFYSPIFIAEREGYYRELGLELDTKEVNPPTATQALLANQFDVAHAASPGIAAALKGAPLKLIYLVAEPSPYWIIAKKDLQAWSDLKGKTIGVSSTTGTQVLDVSRVLAQHGINAQADGINYVVPGGPGDEFKVSGLRAGSIDAGVFAGVGAVVAMADGQSLLGDMHGINTYDYTLWASNQALENKRDLVAAFVLGTLKGVQVYRHNPTRAVEHVTQQLEGNRQWAEQLLQLSASWFADDGLPTDAGLREAIGYKQEASGEPAAVTPEQMLALDLVRQANADLAASGWKP
jgi:ABC-type nitrate/sulfonate/bicarbonate transport system substrate-binding protein